MFTRRSADALAVSVARWVELQSVLERIAEVDEQLQVVVEFGRSPDLSRFAQVCIASRDDGLRILTLNATVGRVGATILQAEVHEPSRAERQPDIPGERERLPMSADPVAGMLDVTDNARPAR